MRVMVDMSVTLLHHGHVRLLKRARELGRVIVGLTSDDEVFRHKGYLPELSFDARKEILESIRYVDEVVETPWMITDAILDEHSIDILIHGSDNSNRADPRRLKVYERTEGVSSSDMRRRTMSAIVGVKNRKALFTPGPSSLSAENILGLDPCFGRGDAAYDRLEERVLARLRAMTGHSDIVRLQGSASAALEIAVRNFVFGRVLLVDTGYYAQRMRTFCLEAQSFGEVSLVESVTPDDLADLGGSFDWIVCVYTETGNGRKCDLASMRRLADRAGAKLLVDATGSIGLEPDHDLADVVAYSSCKGLFGLTGAAFISYNEQPQVPVSAFFLNMTTHAEKKVTGPYHAVCSLDGVLERHEEMRAAVRVGKELFSARYRNRLVWTDGEQPLLCTLVKGTAVPRDNNVVLYSPRALAPGTSVVCHLGEVHLGALAAGTIYDRIDIRD